MFYGLLLWALWSLSSSPFQALGGIHSFKDILSQVVGMTHTEFQGFPSSCAITVHLVMFGDIQNTQQYYRTRLRTAEFVGEACLPPPPCLGLLSILPHTIIVETFSCALYQTISTTTHGPKNPSVCCVEPSSLKLWLATCSGHSLPPLHPSSFQLRESLNSV